MSLAEMFRPEFKALIQEVEAWLEGQPPETWRPSPVVYVTDTTPEFRKGVTDQKTSVMIKPKAEALAYERSQNSASSRALVPVLEKPQTPGKIWIVASTAENTVQWVEVIALPVGSGSA